MRRSPRRRAGPAPAPRAGTLLDKIRVRSSGAASAVAQKFTGFRKYQAGNSGPSAARTNKLGGIPKKKGAGR